MLTISKKGRMKKNRIISTLNKDDDDTVGVRASPVLQVPVCVALVATAEASSRGNLEKKQLELG